MATFLYTEPIGITSPVTLKFVAVDSYGNVGEVQSEEYSLPVTCVGYANLESVAGGTDGKVISTGHNTTTLDGITHVSATVAIVTGSRTVTLQGVSYEQTAKSVITANINYQLASLTSLGTATASAYATAEATYESITGSMTGVVGAAPMTGMSNTTLASLTVSHQASSPCRGIATTLFAGLTSNSNALVPNNSASTKTLSNITVEESGRLSVKCAATTTLGSIATISTAIIGDPLLYGSSTTQLDSIESQHAGITDVLAQSTRQLPNMTSTGTSSVIASGMSEITFDGIARIGSGYTGELLSLGFSDTTFTGISSQSAAILPVTGTHTATISLEGTPIPLFAVQDITLEAILTGFIIPEEHFITKVYVMEEEPRVFRA